MSAGRKSSGGISLVVTLVALALLSLAAVALIRNVDTSNLVAGNLAFKQATTSAADLGVEAAINWLQTNNAGATLQNDDVSNGYYASSLSALDPSGNSSNAARALADWKGDRCAYASSGSFASCVQPSTARTVNGFSIRYLITRMCITTGDSGAAGNACARPVTGSAGDSFATGEIKYGEEKLSATKSGPYFRIVVRAEGPRNTVSTTESYVHF